MRIGIDLGGTKIEGIALDGSRELARRRVQTPRDDYRATVEAVAAVVEQLERQTGSRGSVGVGIPGTLSPDTGLVKNANSVWLIGTPLLDDLQQRLDREVRIANDANCFAMSEATDGAGAGADVVFGVIVGTGTGAGIVVRGALLTGPHGIAGEWGHNPLPWPEEDERPGPPCYCGRRGCVETFLSGPGMTFDYTQRAGRTLSPPQIVAAADDPAAQATVARYEHRMARALAAIVNVLDPDVIVLGGGMSKIGRLYHEVPKLWAPYVFTAAAGSETIRTRLVSAAHGDSSGVRGAAWLWPQRVEA
jgi:fructokinase